MTAQHDVDEEYELEQGEDLRKELSDVVAAFLGERPSGASVDQWTNVMLRAVHDVALEHDATSIGKRRALAHLFELLADEVRGL
jgi:hypothetical protein